MTFTAEDQKYMKLALRLAAYGIGSVEPNPAVGAVIVKDGEIIGKGYHKKFGGPHAEIEALNDCRRRGNDPRGSVVYVSLEPCCHFGKTGPCTEALIKAGVTEVVFAVIDPAAHVRGKGMEQLKAAGIVVRYGLCEAQAKAINAPFFKFAATGKPWVIAKWAQSIDGKLAYREQTPSQRWISGEQSRRDSHRLRRRCQAILVGIGTVLADDPMLTPRPARGRTPLRVVLDTHLQIPLDCNMVKTAKIVPTLVCTNQAAIETKLAYVEQLVKAGVEIKAMGLQDGRIDLDALLAELGSRSVQQLLVEGGPKVLGEFFKRKLVDEVRIYIAPKVLGGAGAEAIGVGLEVLAEPQKMHACKIVKFGEDVCIGGFMASTDV